MNIYLKYFFVVFMMFTSFGHAYASSGFSVDHQFPTEQCYEAKHGRLNVSLINDDDPLDNAYLFDCVVSVPISDPSMTSGKSKSEAQRKSEKEKKSRIADFLLSKKIDVSFKNKYGDTLLMSVISSFLPKEWKAKTVEILIERGVNIESRNDNGDTAMNLAKYKENTTIINILSVERR